MTRKRRETPTDAVLVLLLDEIVARFQWRYKAMRLADVPEADATSDYHAELNGYLTTHAYGPHLHRIAEARYWARLRDSGAAFGPDAVSALRRLGADESLIAGVADDPAARSAVAANVLAALAVAGHVFATERLVGLAERRRTWVRSRKAEGWSVPRTLADWPSDLGQKVSARTISRYRSDTPTAR